MSAQAKVMVLGATGMLGSAMVRLLAVESHLKVIPVVRASDAVALLPPQCADAAVTGLDAESPESLTRVFAADPPEIVINCVGLVKQLAGASQVLDAIPINTLLPHRLAKLCAVAGARLIHISTDCVFSGNKGNYVETDQPDATDLYGMSKWLGEVTDAHTVTLRTSIIGHELRSDHGLLEWFLSQKGMVRGYRRAIFSGLPTVELARVIRDQVIPRRDLRGLYHVSADPISKLELLQLFAAEYGVEVAIEPDDALVIDRSLDSTRFKAETSYRPERWPELVAAMRRFG
jgi:dTDP-4-dehydrorhamnose reductase